MPRNHPPLPTAVRPFYWILRTFGILIGIAAVVIGVLLARQRVWQEAAWVLVSGPSFAILTWLPPTSRWVLPLMVVLALGVSVVLQSWLVAAVLFAAIAWTVWKRQQIGPLPKEFEVVDSDTVMKNAHRFVESFESFGFERAGGYRARIGKIRIIISILLSPDARSYASVTDAVLHLTSCFPDGRTLVTRNSNQSPLPYRMLVNPIPGATPDALVAGHDRALQTLAEHGHFPMPLTSNELVQIAIDSELEAIEWLNQLGRMRRPDDTLTVWDRSDAAKRIASWRGES